MRTRRGTLLLPISLLLFLAVPPLAKAQVAERPKGLSTFEPLRDPHFVPAAKANFLRSEDQVLGVSVNGVAKAYPTQVMAWHHIIQDQLGSIPILATW